MVILFIRLNDWRGRHDHHQVFHHEVIEIGRATSNDLILDHYVIDDHQATLFVEDGMFSIESRGVLPRDKKHRRFPPPLVIDDGRLRLDPYVIELEQYTDPTEIALLGQIERGDHTMREVYADWLEERGEHARAQLLRTQLALLEQPVSSPERDALSERLFALAARVPNGWRACVDRPAIEIGDQAFRVGINPARSARRIAGEPRVTVQLTITGERTPATEVFVPELVSELERVVEHLRPLYALPRPVLGCAVPETVTVTLHRDGPHAVIGVQGAAGEARLSAVELQANIEQLIAILADA